jgi:hypothetical protein
MDRLRKYLQKLSAKDGLGDCRIVYNQLVECINAQSVERMKADGSNVIGDDCSVATPVYPDLTLWLCRLRRRQSD